MAWLWCRPVAVARTGSLAWEPPCARGAALKKKKKKSADSLKIGDILIDFPVDQLFCSETEQDPAGPLRVPLFLICRKKASASQTLPEFQRADSVTN